MTWSADPSKSTNVIPAEAGIHANQPIGTTRVAWMPTFVGMTTGFQWCAMTFDPLTPALSPRGEGATTVGGAR